MTTTMMVQTRSEENGIREFDTLKEAFNHSLEDPSVWKISFSFRQERVRLVSNGDGSWIYEPIANIMVGGYGND